MKKVLFLTKRKYPDGDASSKRDIIFSKYFLDKGYEVIFVGMGKTAYKKVETLGNISFVSLRKYKKPNMFQKVLNHLHIGKHIVNYGFNHFSDADIIFVEPQLFKDFNKKKNMFITKRIIYPVVEYYSPTEYPFGGCLSSTYKKNVFFNTKVKPSDGKIIAISSYLEKHFKGMNMDVIRIPFVLDNNEKEFDIRIESRDKRKFIYCGNPRKKDLLLDILIAFSNLQEDLLKKCDVNIAGVDKNWLLKQKIPTSSKSKILTFTSFWGKLPFSEIKNMYLSCDYSLLLRPSNERYAKAGFPTKISESLEYGIPPVTNFTSDLGLYLKDGFNSVEVHGDTIDAFKDSLVIALEKTNEEIMQMKKNAKKTAVDRLDITCFYDELDKIIKD